MLVGLPDGHRAELVADALAAAITTLPRQLTRSLTWDQGHEMAEHARFTVDTGIAVYFCDPKEPMAARQQREHCECRGRPGWAVQPGWCRQCEMTPENTGRLRACLAFDLSLELPAPTWPTRLGLIRSLSVSGRDPSQCCRDR
jgi:hypothetical protein